MEIQASRARARVGPSGEPILLFDQNRALWDQLLIRRGLAALDRAENAGGSRGPYTLQAAIAACHARARTPEETDWTRIVELYESFGPACAVARRGTESCSCSWHGLRARRPDSNLSKP